MSELTILYGMLVGVSLGLTGGGGSLFAVPLLVFGLSLPPHEAVGVSLAAVGGTSLVGVLQRVGSGEVDLGTGLMFAVCGMAGAPLGSLLARRIPAPALLLAFAGLMLIMSVMMWRTARPGARPAAGDGPPRSAREAGQLGGRFRGSRRSALLVAVGFVTGVLAGLFGVGGGFVIVPALVMVGGMSIHRAIPTSLLVIVLISLSGVTSHFLTGGSISLGVTLWFTLGGVIGMLAGSLLRRRLSGPVLQRGFALGIVAVAAFVITRSVI